MQMNNGTYLIGLYLVIMSYTLVTPTEKMEHETQKESDTSMPSL